MNNLTESLSGLYEITKKINENYTNISSLIEIDTSLNNLLKITNQDNKIKITANIPSSGNKILTCNNRNITMD